MSEQSVMDEATYLQQYDPKQFDSPLVTVDAALFTYHDGVLKVLLVERASHPELGKWGLPGGFIDVHRMADLTQAINGVIEDKTGITAPYLEQLASYGNNRRDKRGWSVTVSYTALMAYQTCEARIATVADAQWVDVAQLPEMTLAFDHMTIIEAGRERLKQKALYSIVPAYALAEEFTFPELQHLHELLIGKPLQKRSFRRRIEQANLLEDTGKFRKDAGRPAILYRLAADAEQYRFVRNLED